MGKWTDHDTAKHSDDSLAQVKEANHDAREHASRSGDLPERNASKTADKVKDSPLGESLRNFFWPHTKGK